jgi:hypothetical protein
MTGPRMQNAETKNLESFICLLSAKRYTSEFAAGKATRFQSAVDSIEYRSKTEYELCNYSITIQQKPRLWRKIDTGSYQFNRLNSRSKFRSHIWKEAKQKSVLCSRNSANGQNRALPLGRARFSSQPDRAPFLTITMWLRGVQTSSLGAGNCTLYYSIARELHYLTFTFIIKLSKPN